MQPQQNSQREQVIAVFKEMGKASSADIVRKTGLPAQNVHAIVHVLKSKDTICTTGDRTAESSRGQYYTLTNQNSAPTAPIAPPMNVPLFTPPRVELSKKERPNVLIVGLSTQENNVSRFCEELGVGWQRWDNGNGVMPLLDACICITSACSHVDMWKSKELYNAAGRPFFTSPGGISSIRDKVEMWAAQLIEKRTKAALLEEQRKATTMATTAFAVNAGASQPTPVEVPAESVKAAPMPLPTTPVPTKPFPFVGPPPNSEILELLKNLADAVASLKTDVQTLNSKIDRDQARYHAMETVVVEQLMKVEQVDTKAVNSLLTAAIAKLDAMKALGDKFSNLNPEDIYKLQEMAKIMGMVK